MGGGTGVVVPGHPRERCAIPSARCEDYPRPHSFHQVIATPMADITTAPGRDSPNVVSSAKIPMKNEIRDMTNNPGEIETLDPRVVVLLQTEVREGPEGCLRPW